MSLRERVIFVTNVHEDIKEANLRELFELCGNITSFKQQWDPARKCFGWEVEYAKLVGAQRAAQLHGKELVGTPLQVLSQAPPPEVSKQDINQVNRNVFLNQALAAASLISQGIDFKQEMVLHQQHQDAIDVLTQPDKDIGGDPVLRTVHVAGFDVRVPERKILEILSTCGPVSQIRSGSLDNTRRYAFVEFMKRSSVPQALALSGTEVFTGLQLVVSPAQNALPQADAKKKPAGAIQNLLSRIEKSKSGEPITEGPDKPDKPIEKSGRDERERRERERERERERRSGRISGGRSVSPPRRRGRRVSSESPRRRRRREDSPPRRRRRHDSEDSRDRRRRR